MEKCVRCGKETMPTSSTAICPKGKFIGVICCECRDEILEDYIVENKIEAERAKVPTLTLEQMVHEYLYDAQDEFINIKADTIIAMVREHDEKVNPQIEFLREQNESLRKLKDSNIQSIHELRMKLKIANDILAEIASTAQAASKREG